MVEVSHKLNRLGRTEWERRTASERVYLEMEDTIKDKMDVWG
jgi:hypothetical protein